jgi:hypothetical protein
MARGDYHLLAGARNPEKPRVKIAYPGNFGCAKRRVGWIFKAKILVLGTKTQLPTRTHIVERRLLRVIAQIGYVATKRHSQLRRR